MSVLRAILGRFARFLVRIARTLDPALTTAPYWVMPERMAALRQRYPGAPEHWLEFVARRTAIDNAATPYAPRPDTVAERIDERPPIAPPQSHTRPPETQRNFLSLRDRPALAFSRSDSRSKPSPSEPRIVAARAASNRPPAAPEILARTRPDLTFITRSVRNPIANLLRIERPARRPATPHFLADDPVTREHHDAADAEPVVRREPQTFFADLGGRDAYRPEAFGGDEPHRGATPARPDTRWPRRPERSLADVTWLNSRPGAPRHDPNFRTHDPRWPELPPLAADYGSSPQASLDDAILFAEQIGGTWSG